MSELNIPEARKALIDSHYVPGATARRLFDALEAAHAGNRIFTLELDAANGGVHKPLPMSVCVRRISDEF